MNTYWPIAERTPISATRPARRPNSSSSWAGRPNSFTSVAPGAEKRSVICVVIAALWSAASRCKWARRPPMRRAGITNSGSSTSASSVIDHDSRSITASVSTSAMTLLTTPDNVHVNARWAPITSLLSRLTRAPVRVRVKNATGMRCTWPNTARRRSRMTPSPILRRLPPLEHPEAGLGDGDDRDRRRPASTTRRALPSVVIASTTRPARTGVRHAEHGTDDRQDEERDQRAARCGRANEATRRSVARVNARRGTIPRSRSPWPSSD